ncbi:MATE efflux family protein [Hypoxylon sp. FL0543]|nr:MATE efflux family protein [Hypoxylon sp. FL0543]
MDSNARDEEVAHTRRTETTPLLSDSQPVVCDNTDGSWGSELRLLFQYSVPLIATYLLQYSYSIITTFVAGHLGADALAAASIGMTTMNIVGFATVEGMATALDTLCAQAYGSGNLAGVGLHVQKMLLLMGLAIVPIGAFWVVSPWALSVFVRQQHLAVMAGSFLRMSLVGLPGYASFEAGKRFLQAQGDFKGAMIAILFCTPVNAFLSWFFAFELDMGLDGAALGVALCNDLRPVVLLCYIMLPTGRSSHQCWGGLSREAFSKWGPMVRLSFAGFAVNLGEWAATEMMTFSTSYLSTNHLAAQSILMTISIVSWHIPFSISVAISTRIGHLIGAGLVTTAQRAAVLYAVVTALIGSIDGFIIFALRHQLLEFFSDDSVVGDIASKTMLTVGVFQIIDAIICCTNGLLRGLGRQSVAAGVVFVVNYLGAVPLAMWLELGEPGLELNGVWIGLGSGMVLIAAIEGIYMKTLRWQDCVASVKLREGL